MPSLRFATMPSSSCEQISSKNRFPLTLDVLRLQPLAFTKSLVFFIANRGPCIWRDGDKCYLALMRFRGESTSSAWMERCLARSARQENSKASSVNDRPGGRVHSIYWPLLGLATAVAPAGFGTLR